MGSGSLRPLNMTVGVQRRPAVLLRAVVIMVVITGEKVNALVKIRVPPHKNSVVFAEVPRNVE